jgi:hypothetical protein
MDNGIIQKLASYFSLLPATINLNFESANESVRLQLAQKMWDFYNGNASDIERYLNTALGRTFTSDDIAVFQLLYLPVMRTIIDKICMVYQGDVTRELEVESENVKLQELYESSNIELKQKEWYKLAKLFHTVLVQPIVRNGRLEFEIWTPNRVSVVPKKDNYLQADVIRYEYQTLNDAGKSVVYTVYWSDTQHFITDDKGEHITSALDNNDKGINPYGVLPFVPLRFRDTENFWGEGETVLLNAEEKIAVLLVLLIDVLVMQGHGQLVFENANMKGNIKTGPRYPIDLKRDNPDQAASASLLESNGKVKEIQDSVDWIINRVMKMYGLNQTVEAGQSQTASGYAKLIDNWDIIEKRWEDVGVLVEFEQRLFEVVKKVAAVEGLETFSDGSKLNIYFENYEFPQDPKVELEVKKLKYDLGLWNPIDDLIASGEAEDEAGAMKIIQRNLEMRQKLKDEFGFFTNNNNQESSSAMTLNQI